jgi:ribosomal-protein-alanine N-acetyltransferase
MSLPIEIRLARSGDAETLAVMSRDMIEHGLGWSWTPGRVNEKIRSADNVVVVAMVRQRVAGFAIMYFGMEEARLNLLAVAPAWRREGVGRRLVRWLEESAVTAGISVVYLEVRASNQSAQKFYRALGYREVEIVSRYYSERESALRMARDLWCPVASGSL